MRRLNAHITVLALLLLSASPLLGGQYQPLEIGNWWSYIDPGGFIENVEVPGTETILDTETYVLAYSDINGFTYLRNFWTNGENGEVYLYGYDRGSFGFFYDPPIKAFDPNMAVGDSWTSHYDAYNYLDGSFLFAGEATYMIFETGVYEVGAGSFPATAVGEVVDSRRGDYLQDFNHAGQPQPEPGRVARYWYGENVGLVQYLGIDGMVTLESYFGNNVSTVSSSLEEIKALYR